MRSRTIPVSILAAVLLAAAASPGLARGETEHSYTGTKKCRVCHFKEYNSWKETKMAKVFDLLRPGVRADKKKEAGLDPDKDYTADPECLPCHTVGYEKPGGFVSISETPDHAGVGCEMCHGPGGTYTRSGYMTLKNREYKRSELVAVGLVEKVGREQCVVCHNDESPFVEEGATFDYEANKDKGIHEIYPLKYDHE